MSMVEMKISGLALCKPDFATSGMLEVLFIDPRTIEKVHHRLSVVIKMKSAGKSKNLLSHQFNEKTRIVVELIDSTSVLPGIDNDLNDIVNFDSYYTDPLRLKDVKSSGKPPRISYLTIPGALPFTAEMDRNTYRVDRQSGSIVTPIQSEQDRRVTQTVGTNFQINPGGFISLSIEVEKLLKLQTVVPYEEGINYEIEFENECQAEPDGKCQENDYPHYYEVLDGVDRNGRSMIILSSNGHDVDQQACNASTGGENCDFGCYFIAGTCVC